MGKSSISSIISLVIKCCGIVFLLLLVLGVLSIWSDNRKPKQTNTQQTSNNTETAKFNQQAENKLKTPPESKWQYSEDQDKMRGITSHFATLQSETKVDTGFIGKSSVRMYLRSSGKNKNDIFFTVDNGVFHCSPLDNCIINVQFDGGNIKTIPVVEGEATLGDTLFIADEQETARFVGNLRKSRSMLVEFSFVNHGREQFEFDTQGLKWAYF